MNIPQLPTAGAGGRPARPVWRLASHLCSHWPAGPHAAVHLSGGLCGQVCWARRGGRAACMQAKCVGGLLCGALAPCGVRCGCLQEAGQFFTPLHVGAHGWQQLPGCPAPLSCCSPLPNPAQGGSAVWRLWRCFLRSSCATRSMSTCCAATMSAQVRLSGAGLARRAQGMGDAMSVG